MSAKSVRIYDWPPTSARCRIAAFQCLLCCVAVGVNIRGTANILRHFPPAMITHGSGAIVNSSSGWGRSAASDAAPYSASTLAIEGLTRELAQELPTGMPAAPLNPGIIDTEMLRRAFGDSAGDYESTTAWAELAVPFILKLGPKHNGKPLTVG